MLNCDRNFEVVCNENERICQFDIGGGGEFCLRKNPSC